MARNDIKETRRVQLIEATIDSIAKRGFAKTTLADVAREAKLSQGIVNFYFKTKKALLIAALRHMVDEYENLIEEAMQSTGASPAARLDTWIEIDFDPVIVSRKKVTVWYAFWGETRWRSDFLRLCTRRSETYQAQAHALIQEVIDAGGYTGLDAASIARGLNAMIDGLWLDMLINPKNCSREKAKRACRTYLAQLFPREFGRQPSTATAA